MENLGVFMYNKDTLFIYLFILFIYIDQTSTKCPC